MQNTPADPTQLPDLSAYAYNDANQRVRRTLGDGSYWVYSYDALGQVTSGKRHWNDGTPVAGQQFEYAFDDIGNRTSTKAGGDATGLGTSLRPATYTRNLLNQYTKRDTPTGFDVLGLATESSTVSVSMDSVNQGTVYERGEYFRKELTVANSSAPKWVNLSVSAGGTATTGYQFIPKDSEDFGSPTVPATYPGYDLDGNLLRDGRWKYTWDAENRLLKLEPVDWITAPTGSRRQLDFKYDALGRRIWKKVTNLDTSTVLSETRFLYDGWNLLAELSGASGTTTLRTYLWGSDLSGSLQGAGGVGGLLAVRPTATGISHFAGYDGNGNLTLLVDGSTGLASATYEYGPFGEPLRVTGPMGSANPFAFSTKFTDRESGLLYYGYRYYSPSLGRWLNRDPLGEAAALSRYAFVNNGPAINFDYLGNRTLPITWLPFVEEGWLSSIGGSLTGLLAGGFYYYNFEIYKQNGLPAPDEYPYGEDGAYAFLSSNMKKFPESWGDLYESMQQEEEMMLLEKDIQGFAIGRQEVKDKNCKCRFVWSAFQLGGWREHDDYAKKIFGQRKELIVTAPNGDKARYDGAVNYPTPIVTVGEVKTGRRWSSVVQEKWSEIQKYIFARDQLQFQKQETVAATCNLQYEIWFKERLGFNGYLNYARRYTPYMRHEE